MTIFMSLFFISFIWLLCVFIGAFSLFTFKLIIDRYVLIAILLIVFWLFCSSYLFLSSFVLSSCALMTSFSVMFVFLSFVLQGILCVCVCVLAWSSFITTYEYRSLTWWSRKTEHILKVLHFYDPPVLCFWCHTLHLLFCVSLN